MLSDKDPILNDAPEEEGEGTEFSRFWVFGLLHFAGLFVLVFAAVLLDDYLAKVGPLIFVLCNFIVVVLTLVAIMSTHKESLTRGARKTYALFVSILNFAITCTPILIAYLSKFNKEGKVNWIAIAFVLAYHVIQFGLCFGIALRYKR